ncbi:hypothetical protein M3Y96_00130500 [Aphelenchoides besseyi]|nr:hypothetical protein M3Y96_00130500 [Aphelenchoides besseyi]
MLNICLLVFLASTVCHGEVNQSLGRWRRSTEMATQQFELPDPFNLKKLFNPQNAFKFGQSINSPTPPPALLTSMNSGDPLRLDEMSQSFIDQSGIHQRLHRLSNSAEIKSAPVPDMFKVQQDPGIKSAPKQPFVFHLAQDFFTAVVNFLFQFMI